MLCVTKVKYLLYLHFKKKTMDLEKLKKEQNNINVQSLKEIFEELPDEVIKFSTSNLVKYCLEEIKSSAKNKQSPRVIHNWIKSEIIKIPEEEKGKNRRFSRLENIWINIASEARKFGLPLEYLKQSRIELLELNYKTFSYLKFYVLDSILRKPKILLIFENGYTRVISFELYSKWISKGIFPTHLSFKLMDYVSLEFPENAFEFDFKISNPYEEISKMKMLYFLKTGDYKHIKLFVNDTDVRLIENSKSLLKNKELLKILSEWKFLKAEIVINDDVETVIKL